MSKHKMVDGRLLQMNMEAYYTSQQWKDDYAMDEAGTFPEKLKRGVLSQDGIWNLLERNRELIRRLGISEVQGHDDEIKENGMGYCTWAGMNEANQIYHDTEWGIPVHDDRQMFEHLTLECLQCGLSWDLMLKKRKIFRECFCNFEYDRIATFGDEDVERILNTEGMILHLVMRM